MSFTYDSNIYFVLSTVESTVCSVHIVDSIVYIVLSTAVSNVCIVLFTIQLLYALYYLL